MTEAVANCPLCAGDGGRVVWRSQLLRIIQVQEAGFPAFYRVVANGHVAEWTDLPAPERTAFMQAVEAMETALRDTLSPTKINLASLGNMVPHLHWHVIARFEWDSHFPAPVWASAVRPRNPAAEAQVEAKLREVEARLLATLD